MLLLAIASIAFLPFDPAGERELNLMPNEMDNIKLHVDMSDYWLIIRKRYLLIFFVFAVVLSATISYTLKEEPIFQSECKILISARQPMATIEGAQITWYGARGHEMTSEVKLISGKDETLRQVLDILRLRADHPTSSVIPAEAYLDADKELPYIKRLAFSEAEKNYIRNLNVNSLRGLLQIEPVPQSNIVSIKAQTPYPSVAEAIANVLAIVYRADSWHIKTQDASQTKRFIEEQLDKVKSELEKNKSTLEKASEETNAIGSAKILQDELTNLRIELQKLQEKYTPEYPKVKKQLKVIASLEEKLAKLPSTKNKYDDSMAEWELKQGLRKNLGEYYLKAEIDYEAKRQKAKDEVFIISDASRAGKLKPNEMMNIIVGAIFGIILGCLCAFIWEGLDTSIGKIEDVERITQLHVIAHIPLIGERIVPSSIMLLSPFKPFWKLAQRLYRSVIPQRDVNAIPDFDKKLIFNLNPLSVEAEAYRTLRTNIHFAIGPRQASGATVISITSSSPREGKTLTSTNLAIEIAQMGKMALLLEADMRRPCIAKLFKLNEKPGLSDILVGTAKADAAVRTLTDMLISNSEWEKFTETQGLDNLHILPCGTIPPNPTELLLSPDFKALIESFRSRYDFIIIDTPPTLPVSDPSIIGPIVDGTVLVYQSDRTSRHLLLRAIQTLLKNNTKLLGIVINQLSFDVILRSSSMKYSYSAQSKTEKTGSQS